MRAYKSAYAVPLPTVANGSFSLQFSSRISGSTYGFLFQWINSAWALSVTFPDKSVRLASTVPGVISWSTYPDYGLLIASSLVELGQNDLSTVSMYWINWS